MQGPLRLTQLECCGVREASSQPGFQNYSKEQFERWLKRSAHVLIPRIGRMDRIKLYSWGETHGGILMATASELQKPYGEWLKKVGFKKVRRFYNFNTGRWVSVYFYTLEGQRDV